LFSLLLMFIDDHLVGISQV
jgi:hypothetical protein